MTGPAGLRYDRYRVNGRDEWLMRIGPEDGRPVLFVPALFEEMNRTRALLAGVMRSLGAEGFRCTLPDLPGTGESARALEECIWADWEDAVETIAVDEGGKGGLLIASLRGGALLDAAPAAGYWRLSPTGGRSLLRDLDRAALTGGGGSAGYHLSDDLASALGDAEPAPRLPSRTVRLASDPKPADAKFAGPALWRRSEPATSTELTQLIACDISAWVRRCASS